MRLHGLRLRYFDIISATEETVTVFADGFDDANAEEVAELDAPGVTSADQAAKLAKFKLLRVNLGQETIDGR